MEKKVLVVLPVQERHKAALEAAAPGCTFDYSTVKTVTAEQVACAQAIVGNAPAGLIRASEKLELLQLNSAGADAYIKPGVLAPSTVLTNSTGAYSKAVAEHALAAMLSLMKKLPLYRDAQKKAVWSDFGTVTSPADATVLVVGLGDIGLHFARLCKGLGAPRVIGVKRRPGSCPEGVDELYTTDELDRLLPEADVILSVLPGTAATKGIWTAERFAAMKKSAYFLNMGRGTAVSSEVLCCALQEGMIAGAAVDVTDPEPLPGDSPLWQLDNLLLTPHISGQYHLPETFERVVKIACRNLTAWSRGEELMNIVDFATGYKK